MNKGYWTSFMKIAWAEAEELGPEGQNLWEIWIINLVNEENCYQEKVACCEHVRRNLESVIQRSV